MDYFTPAAIKAAIQWMKEQTEANSISNIFLGDLLNSMVDGTPDFNNLTNVQKRQLKNAMNSITTGSMTTSQIYSGFYQDYVKLNLSQQEYEDQEITALKGKYTETWLLGEAPYTMTIKEAIPAGNPPENQYFSFQTTDGQNIAFGGTLGGVPAGFNVGMFNQSANFKINLFGVPGEAHFVDVSVKFTNEVTDKANVFPAMFAAKGEGTLRVLMNEGETKQVKIIDVYKSLTINWTFPASMAGPNDGGYYRLLSPVTLLMIVNGVQVAFYNYPAGQAMQTIQVGWENNFVNDLMPGDVVELKFIDTME